MKLNVCHLKPIGPAIRYSAGMIGRLDTLRALAVSVILLFHLKPDFLPWGYVGVDMFFSISGFLMTLLYLRACESGRSFPVGRFIARRFWRIFPPLAITVLVSLIVATLLLSPSQLVSSCTTGLAALASVSNWFFYQEAGYFDTDAITKPFLHTWSLGIEEQFYVVFALLLVLARWVSFKILLVTTTLCSFSLWAFVVLAEMETGFPTLYENPFGALFYLPQYRAFQFSFGGLAAYAINYRFRGSVVIGVSILIGTAFIASNEETAYLAAPLITLGMALIMIHAPFLDAAAVAGPVRYVAKISYQLYLVHWPIIVYWHHITMSPLGWLEAAVCLVICMVMADVLYRITNPMRSAG